MSYETCRFCNLPYGQHRATCLGRAAQCGGPQTEGMVRAACMARPTGPSATWQVNPSGVPGIASTSVHFGPTEQPEVELEDEAQTREWSILEHFHACGLAAQNQREKRSAPEFWDCEPV